MRRKVQARFGGGPTEKCLTRELAGGLAYQDRDEMEVLFTFFSERYERKSLMLSTNLVFSEWERIFKHPMTALAAIDRIVHHSVILDLMEVESHRATEASLFQQTQERSTQAASVK